mmetsp:Transcript_101115/g.163112  ORF Transcript_101115/g.163112 Transcript_101115/m.163112 type:complete len:279 (+) Transcript_101115:639-1475(+)
MSLLNLEHLPTFSCHSDRHMCGVLFAPSMTGPIRRLWRVSSSTEMHGDTKMNRGSFCVILVTAKLLLVPQMLCRERSSRRLMAAVWNLLRAPVLREPRVMRALKRRDWIWSRALTTWRAFLVGPSCMTKKSRVFPKLVTAVPTFVSCTARSQVCAPSPLPTYRETVGRVAQQAKTEKKKSLRVLKMSMKRRRRRARERRAKGLPQQRAMAKKRQRLLYACLCLYSLCLLSSRYALPPAYCNSACHRWRVFSSQNSFEIYVIYMIYVISMYIHMIHMRD